MLFTRRSFGPEKEDVVRCAAVMMALKDNNLRERCLEFQALRPGSSAADRFTPFGHKHIHLYKHPSTQAKGTTLSALTFIESQRERDCPKTHQYGFQSLPFLRSLCGYQYECVCVFPAMGDMTAVFLPRPELGCVP